MEITADNQQIASLLIDIDKKYGYSFNNYAFPSIERRINRFLSIEKIDSIEQFRKKLLSDESYFAGFVEELTVNVTEMFRDPDFYRALREKIIPQLATYPHLRIWHAGCSTGEEVYSMAILLKEENLLDRTLLYATDINQNVIETAKKGTYPLNLMRDYTKNYILSGGKHDLSGYYKAGSNTAKFDPSLTKRMVFSMHNLATDQSFNEFNLIVCRNVLIYFNKQLQDNVLSLFSKSIGAFGFLALGNKETIRFSGIEKHFSVVDRNEKIWRKINQQEI